MADAIEAYQVTCPAFTPPANAIEVACTFDPAEVEVVAVRWPSGHASKTGIALAVAHQVVVPNTPNTFLIGTSMERTYPLARLPHTGAWSVFVYNTDIIPHYWQVEFHTSLINAPSDNVYAQVAPLNASHIHAARDRLRQRR